MPNRNNIKIEDIHKGNPFSVPEKYFDNFPIRMANKISEKVEVKSPIPENAWFKPRYAAILAFSSVLLLLLIGLVFVNYHHNPLSSKEMVEAYRYSAIQDLTDEQLAQMTTDNQDFSDTTAQYKKEVIEYLSKDNLDINRIIDVQ
jgi:hypothetical protein